MSSAPVVASARPPALSPLCQGAQVDLTVALRTAGCFVDRGTPTTATRVEPPISITAVASPTQVGPGDDTTITVTFTNTSDAAVTLGMLSYPPTESDGSGQAPDPADDLGMAGFSTRTSTLGGKSVTEPRLDIDPPRTKKTARPGAASRENKKDSTAGLAAEFGIIGLLSAPTSYAWIEIAPRGRATVGVPWRAEGYNPAKVYDMSRGYQPPGPLLAGEYDVTVYLPGLAHGEGTWTPPVLTTRLKVVKPAGPRPIQGATRTPSRQ